MKTRSSNNFLLALAVIAMLLMAEVGVFAQNLTNTATGNINNAGTIRFRQNAGQFLNARANPVSGGFINNTGTLEFSGVVAAQVFDGANPVGVAGQRIGGTVAYTHANAVAVAVTGNGGTTYYTNLTLAGASTKSVPDNVYIYGVYDPSTSGNRTYAGTFHYDRQAADDQVIYPENNGAGGVNRYNNLDLIGDGTKTVVYDGTPGDAGTVHVEGSLTQIAAVSLRVYDDMRINMTAATASTVDGPVLVGDGVNDANFFMINGDATYGSTVDIASGDFNIEGQGNGIFNGVVTIANGAMNMNAVANGNATYNANVNINNAGLFLLNGAGTATFEAASTVAVAAGGTLRSNDGVAGQIDINGNLSLANDATALLDLGDNTQMFVAGAFTNALDLRTNMLFGDGSTVTYDGAVGQAIMTTVTTNPGNDYFNLSILGAAGNKVPVNNATSPNINLRGDFTLGNAGDYLLDMAGVNSAAYVNISGNGDANFSGVSEVFGKFRRTGFAAGATVYNFNNAQTQLTFSTAPTQFFQLDVRRNTAPDITKIAGPTPPVVDINRRITVERNLGAGTDGEISKIRLAYLPAEYTGTRADRLRLLEAYGDASVHGDKITTGIPITTRDIDAAGFDYLELDGANNPPSQHMLAITDNYGTPGNIWEVSRNSDIVITDEVGLMISIRNGRWSDPETWDEGRKPISEDNCIVRHVVWTGYDQAAFGSRAWTDNEESTPGLVNSNGGVVLANSVTIANSTYPNGGPERSLLIGNEDNAAGTVMVFGVSTGLGNGMFNLQETAAGAWAPNWANSANLQGLWVLAPGGYTPVIRTSQLENRGSINNSAGSTIEIGD